VDARLVGVANAVVSTLLRSPLHGILSRSTALIRYTGRRSGRRITTPTQYALRGEDVIIAVGRPETKTWWRNFRTHGDIEVLIRRQWRPMTARAVEAADDPDAIAPLVAAYLERFPKAARALGVDADDSRGSTAVVVLCRPR